jgi:hypothetical protein
MLALKERNNKKMGIRKKRPKVVEFRNMRNERK